MSLLCEERNVENSVAARRISVFLVEDHAAIRHSIRILLGELKQFEVVGEMDVDPGATQLCAELQPDLVILDLRLPRLCAPEFAQAVSKLSPRSRILCYSGYITREVGMEMMRRGVRGFVHKGSSLDVLFEAITRVANGEMYCDSVLELPENRAGGTSADVKLTTREVEVGRMISDGFSTKEIAARLEISPFTVANHRSNLMRKLGVHDVVGVMRALKDRGFFNILN